MPKTKSEEVDKDNGAEKHQEPEKRRIDPYEKCPWGPMRCIKKVEHRTDICPRAPCRLNANRFGTHERIIDHYIWNEDWNDAYYYIQDLLQPLLFACPTEEMDRIRELRHEGREIELTDYSQGCRIFVISNRLKTLKRDLVKHQYKYAELDDSEIGNNVKETYRKKRTEFIEYIDSFMDTLKHLAKDEEYTVERELMYFDKLQKLYDTALEAHKKGLQVQTGMGNQLEQGFVNAAKGSGLLERIGKKNRERLKKVNEKFKKEQEEKEGE